MGCSATIGWLGTAVLLAGSGCIDSPPEDPVVRLTVAVWTDMPVPGMVDRIVFELSQGGAVAARAGRPLDRLSPGSAVTATLASGQIDRRVPCEVRVVGRRGEFVLVERHARFGRLPPGNRVLGLTLEARCAGVPCPDGWTCRIGRCERADADPSSLVESLDDLPADPLASLVRGRRVEGCFEDADCEDGDPCTIDGCATHQCHSRRISPCGLCASDEDCLPLDTPCMEAECHPYGVCTWRNRPQGTRCDDDGDPCTIQCCRELGTCMGFDICLHPDHVTECLPE